MHREHVQTHSNIVSARPGLESLSKAGKAIMQDMKNESKALPGAVREKQAMNLGFHGPNLGIASNAKNYTKADYKQEQLKQLSIESLDFDQ